MREKGWLAYQKVGTAGELGTKKKKKGAINVPR